MAQPTYATALVAGKAPRMMANDGNTPALRHPGYLCYVQGYPYPRVIPMRGAAQAIACIFARFLGFFEVTHFDIPPLQPCSIICQTS